LQLIGKAFKLGDRVDTDQITPGRYLDLPLPERSRHVLENDYQDFSKSFEPGGILVAGVNFGCGSSRETAPEALKHIGVTAILAESFARIFFRNAIAIGLPVLTCPGITAGVKTGDQLELDVIAASVKNLASDQIFTGEPLGELMIDSLQAGGILEMLQNQ
jgi:3-isopropylmalate/(R)-2-methylmalate dehydratase small subunit